MGAEQIWLGIFLIILLLDYAFDRLMDYLNASRWTRDLPPELAGIIEPERYRKAHRYARDRNRLGMITATLSLLLLGGMLLFGGFGWLDSLLRQYTQHPVLIALLFFALLGLVADVLSTPLDVYATFVVEERYGFNRTTPSTYLADKLKGWVLALVLGGGLMAAFSWFYQTAGSLFWLYAWALFTAFSVFMTMFYSTLLVPLFNKQLPLEAGELRNAIESFARKAGFQLDNIYVIDGSKRSTKANAYFSGLGPKKRIVLYDTLIKDHGVDELVAILAHEIAHYKKKHTLKGTLISVAQSGVMLYLLGLFINRPEPSMALGAEQAGFHLGLLAFGLLYAPVSLLLGMLGNHISRRFEYQADAFAARHHDAEALQSALKKLAVNHLSHLRPHPACVFVHYSHPPLLQRLAHLETCKQKPSP